jgi:mannan endo-1,4-beta-mannosidase
VIGFDIYQRNNTNDQFISAIDKMLTMLETIATANKKIPALTEFGGNLGDNSWWTGTFLKVLQKHRISYVLGWRNAGAKPGGSMEYYVPYKGNSAAADFEAFYKAEITLFQKDVSKEKIYR